MGEKSKVRLKRNDQGMPGWNVYVGMDEDFSKITFYPEAGTIYFEVKPRPEVEKPKIKSIPTDAPMPKPPFKRLCPKCGSEMDEPLPAIFRDGDGLWSRCPNCGYESKLEGEK